MQVVPFACAVAAAALVVAYLRVRSDHLAQALLLWAYSLLAAGAALLWR